MMKRFGFHAEHVVVSLADRIHPLEGAIAIGGRFSLALVAIVRGHCDLIVEGRQSQRTPRKTYVFRFTSADAARIGAPRLRCKRTKRVESFGLSARNPRGHEVLREPARRDRFRPVTARASGSLNLPDPGRKRRSPAAIGSAQR